MKITKTSVMTGITRTRDIPVTQEQIDRWSDGEPIQVAMANLTPDDREFIMTGVVPDEWDTLEHRIMKDKDE